MAAPHVDAVVDACSASVRKYDARGPEERPPTLYHFTDLDGLTGILTRGCLWASLATTLNDASEVQYGRNLAIDILRERQATAPTEFDRRVLRYLVNPGAAPPGNDFELFPLVISFCGRNDRSGMWLNYGRSGRGLAIGFAPSIAESTQMDLSRIDYDKASQVGRMTELLNAGNAALGPAPSYSQTNDGAHLTSMYVSWRAVRLKHPAFAEEDEWRLSVQGVAHNGKLVDGTAFKFRRTGERLVPFEERSFGGQALVKKLVLGHTSPVAEEAARTLLYAHGYQPAVERSDVPVR